MKNRRYIVLSAVIALLGVTATTASASVGPVEGASSTAASAQVVGSVAPPSPANEAAAMARAYTDCYPPKTAHGALCVWEGTVFSGVKYAFYGDNKNWDAWPRLINNDSSWFNNHNTKSARIYNGRNYTGSSICFGRGEGDGYPLVSNTGESNRFVSSC